MKYEETVVCIRCGEPVDLNYLHPNSLSVPEDYPEAKIYAVHGDGKVCGVDRRAWIVEPKRLTRARQSPRDISLRFLLIELGQI